MVAGGMHGCRGGWGACVVAGGAWLLGACMVAGGAGMVVGGMHGCRGACVVAGGAWLQGACVIVGGMHGGGVCVVGGACMRYDEVWSMSGRYASYWNAFLF